MSIMTPHQRSELCDIISDCILESIGWCPTPRGKRPSSRAHDPRAVPPRGGGACGALGVGARRRDGGPPAPAAREGSVRFRRPRGGMVRKPRIRRGVAGPN
ncbi:hypothetical protein DFH09DRAFT_1373398 [Mycena vulgaris]|nr:hypothetical protein DFH09DRAFT_1373398 [Mycena vulgaris]